MIHLILWAVLFVESLAVDPTVQDLLRNSTLLGCGTCAICSTCYSNCGPGNIGFDQDNVLTSLCAESTSSTQFWGCLCTQAPVGTLVSAASASLANCPSNYPNSTLNSVLTEFSSICVALGFPAPNFSTASGTSATSSLSHLSTGAVTTSYTSTLSNSETSFSSISGSTPISVTTILQGISLPSRKFIRLLGGTPTTILESQHGSGLSSGAVGGTYRGWNTGYNNPFDQCDSDTLFSETSE